DRVQPAQRRLGIEPHTPEETAADGVHDHRHLAVRLDAADGVAVVAALRLDAISQRPTHRKAILAAADTVRADRDALDVHGVLGHVLTQLLAQHLCGGVYTLGEDVAEALAIDDLLSEQVE